MDRRRLAWMVWLGAGLLVVMASLALFRPAPLPVDTKVVTRGAFLRTVDEEARTRVRERYVVSAPLAGRLLRIALKPGDPVKADSTVASVVPSYPALLDTRSEQELLERVGAADARVTSAKASVERAAAAAALAQSDLARVQSLADQGFASRQAQERAAREADVKAKELAVAQFDAHAVEHELAVARAALSYARRGGNERGGGGWTIPSPVAGRVLRVIQESETIVPVGAPLLEIGDPAALEVVADILTTDAEAIHAGDAVEIVRGRASPPLAGRVRLVEPAAFTKVSALGIEEQRTHVVIDWTSPFESWRDLGDAYRLDVRIGVERRDDALLVPTAALFRAGSEWAAFVVEDGRARLRKLRIAARNPVSAVVEDGLQPGERVILYPASAIGDGVRVRAPAP